MIYTVTLNPSIDLFVELKNLNLGGQTTSSKKDLSQEERP